MKSNIYIQMLVVATLAIILSACSSRVAIENVDFAQPVETVVQAGSDGQVTDTRTGVSFNLQKLLEKEGLSVTDFSDTDVRMIRNHQGYYFITAAGFRNVYVMKSGENELRSENIIHISSDRLENPSLNQRNPYIQLIYGDRSVNLTKDGTQ